MSYLKEGRNMGLKSWFTKKLNKKKIEPVTNTEIFRIEDYVILPKRSNLNTLELRDLERYKREYKNILKMFKSKTLQSANLNISDFRLSLKTQTELLSSLISDEDDIKTKKMILGEGFNEVNEPLIKELKLNIYLNNIHALKLEITLRLMALKEIYKETPYFSKSKKESIASEINNLEGNYLSSLNQETAVISMVEAYKSEHITLEKKFDEYSLKKRKIYLESLAHNTIPHVLKALESNITKNEVSVAILECELECFVYENADILKIIELELRESYSKWKEIRDYFLKEKNTPHYELEIVGIAENILEIFSLFRKYLASDELLNLVYEYKLDLLLHCPMIGNDYLPESTSEFSKFQMAKVLEQKVIDLGMGKFDNFNEQFRVNTIKATLAVRNMCRDKTKKFNFLNVLEDYDKVNLIMSLDKEDGIIKYFDNTMTSISREYGNFYGRGFTWKERVPLASRSVMEYYGKICEDGNLNRLFNYLKETEFLGDYFLLPDGIVKILTDKEDIELSLAVQQIRKEAFNKILVTPVSLKILTGSIFTDIPLEKAELNDGLETLNLNTLNSTKHIVIPSTVKHFAKASLEKNSQVKIVEFKDFLKSSRYRLIYDMDRDIFLQSIINEIDMRFQDNVYKDFTLDKLTSVEEIRFTDDSLSQSIVINREDMQHIIVRVSLDSKFRQNLMNIDGTWHDIEKIVEEKRNIIENYETGGKELWKQWKNKN